MPRGFYRDVDCYCDLWEKEDMRQDFLRRGVPPGFCGLCERCGRPEHLRLLPGSAQTRCLCFRHRLLHYAGIFASPFNIYGLATWFGLGFTAWAAWQLLLYFGLAGSPVR